MKTVLFLSTMILMAGAASYAQEPPVESSPAPAATDESEKKPATQDVSPDSQATSPSVPVLQSVTVHIAGLYGDWKMVLPEWPGFDKPVIGDFCNFKKQDAGIAVSCADGFLQKSPEAALDDEKLKLRWGGKFTHTIYNAVLTGNGNFVGEIVQASMGIVTHRFKANMERVLNQTVDDTPQESLVVLNNYFADLASKSVREKYYEAGVYNSMKEAVAKRDYPHVEFAVKYFGKILEQTGHVQTFPDVFKASSAASGEQWCLVRIDAEGLADVRCRDIS